MDKSEVIAKFVFVVNKSFLNSGAITVPSSLVVALRENLIGEGSDALISFRDGDGVAGSIRTGWRAGGRYYQISSRSILSMAKPQLMMGSKLNVQVTKIDGAWWVLLD